ncbi:MAG TPA: carbonic anhydrase family protein [Bryobacteraceae bacterium]|nr:carbonic anhydrase family protein [Bryobacteraceae bacterium]
MQSHPMLRFAAVFAAAVAVYAQGWNHDPSSQMGPKNWGSAAPNYATCGTTTNAAFVAVGAKQTPIDIVDTSTLLAIMPSLGFHYADTAMDVENTGHVVEVPYEAGSYVTIGDDVTDVYFLQQFHFHAPSEHTLNGQQYDAELHLVHANRLGELLVVGVLLRVTDQAQRGIFDDIGANAPTSVKTNTVATTVNAMNLLPETQLYYTYTGSLTTPPCTEGVRWVVMTTPVAVTSGFVQQLHTITAGFPNYSGYANNNRPIQPLNGRAVIAAQ